MVVLLKQAACDVADAVCVCAACVTNWLALGAARVLKNQSYLEAQLKLSNYHFNNTLINDSILQYSYINAINNYYLDIKKEYFFF